MSQNNVNIEYLIAGGAVVVPAEQGESLRVIEGGAVWVKCPEILAILEMDQARTKMESGALYVVHRPDHWIVPGLINLHCHLDYSGITDIDESLSLFDWLEVLVARSRALSPDELSSSALAGAREALSFGTTCLVDSSFTGFAALALMKAGMRGLVGLELFGLDQSDAHAAWQAWCARMDALQATIDGAVAAGEIDPAARERVALTVAPHAPYTVSPALWRLADEWSRSRDLLYTAHVAETQDELDWLCGAGQRVHDYLHAILPPFKHHVLSAIDWRSNDPRHTDGAVDHLARHGLLSERLLAAHVVHIDERQAVLLAQSGSRAALCPRSNARLGSRGPDARLLQSAGVRFGLGTDSRASTSDLSLLQEVMALDPSRDKDKNILDLLPRVTIQAARALGLDHRIGSLEPGKAADIAIFDRLSATSSACDVFVDGLSIHK